jgi:hypothetical protein
VSGGNEKEKNKRIKSGKQTNKQTKTTTVKTTVSG